MPRTMIISDKAIADAEGFIAEAAAASSVLAAPYVERLARESGLSDGRARTRLLMAHLEGGDEDEAVSLCASAMAGRADLADFCRELVTHSQITPRVMKVFVRVVGAAMPAHPGARLDAGREALVKTVYDGMWESDMLAVTAPRADGFASDFTGVLVSTEEPLRRFSIVSVVKRVGDTVFLRLKEHERFTPDKYCVAPPALLMVGTLQPEPSRLSIMQAKLQRGRRRLSAILNR